MTPRTSNDWRMYVATHWVTIYDNEVGACDRAGDLVQEFERRGWVSAEGGVSLWEWLMSALLGLIVFGIGCWLGLWL